MVVSVTQSVIHVVAFTDFSPHHSHDLFFSHFSYIRWVWMTPLLVSCVYSLLPSRPTGLFFGLEREK